MGNAEDTYTMFNELPHNPNCSGLGYRQAGMRPELPSLVMVVGRFGARTAKPLNKPLARLFLGKMKPIHYGILFLVSILLASITSVSPWAEAVFQVGKYVSPWFDQVEETDEMLTLPIYSWDKSLRVDGCPRGAVEGLDYYLDCWIWFGRATFICQTGLWLIFLFGAAFRKGFKIVAIWSAGLIIIFFLFFLALHPIVECLYIQFPPPLIFAKQWQINIWSTLFCIINIFFGVWINVSIYKPPIRYKAG